MITAPVAKALQFSGTLKNTRALLTTPSRMAPTAAPSTVALPPISGVPPMMAAAMAVSSEPVPMLGSPES